MGERLPMFPLNNGLFPGALLPLRVFEPGYLSMIDACLDATSEFGVVLISRGSEVGGGEERYDIGTVATIMGMRTLEDGNTLVIARGTSRMRVVDWYEDDPYPQALIERLTEPAGFHPDPELRDRLDRSFDRALGLLAELGVDVGAATGLPTETVAATYQAIALVPVEAFDRQRILEMNNPADRLSAAIEAIESSNELTEARLS